MPAVQRLCFRLRAGQNPLRVAVKDLPKQLNLIADFKKTKPDDFSCSRLRLIHEVYEGVPEVCLRAEVLGRQRISPQ